MKLLVFLLLRSAQQMKNKLHHFLLFENQMAKKEFISTLRFPGNMGREMESKFRRI
jgi:hypothetical protein